MSEVEAGRPEDPSPETQYQLFPTPPAQAVPVSVRTAIHSPDSFVAVNSNSLPAFTPNMIRSLLLSNTFPSLAIGDELNAP